MRVVIRWSKRTPPSTVSLSLNGASYEEGGGSSLESPAVVPLAPVIEFPAGKGAPAAPASTLRALWEDPAAGTPNEGALAIAPLSDPSPRAVLDTKPAPEPLVSKVTPIPVPAITPVPLNHSIPQLADLRAKAALAIDALPLEARPTVTPANPQIGPATPTPTPATPQQIPQPPTLQATPTPTRANPQQIPQPLEASSTPAPPSQLSPLPQPDTIPPSPGTKTIPASPQIEEGIPLTEEREMLPEALPADPTSVTSSQATSPAVSVEIPKPVRSRSRCRYCGSSDLWRWGRTKGWRLAVANMLKRHWEQCRACGARQLLDGKEEEPNGASGGAEYEYEED